MTTISKEENDKYEAIRKHIIDELCPENIPYDETADVHMVIDPNWESGHDWHDDIRSGNPVNVDQSGIAKFNKMLMDGGRIVIKMKSQPISAAIV